MAEQDGEKTEHLSQKKLEQSRERGELPRSQELATFVVFGIVLMYFGMVRQGWFDQLGDIMRDLLSFDRYLSINQASVGEFLLAPVLKAMALMAPLFGLILVLSPLTNMTQTGFNLASERIGLNWERMSPLAGLKRLVGLQQWVEGGKSCLKILVFGWLAWLAVKKYMPQIVLLGEMDVRSQLELLLDVSLSIGTRVAVLMAVLAIADYAYQWWEFQKRMRMTQQEMKEETKEREGNPLIKQRQRSLQMQRARARMMAAVPKASVIVTNPTHYAVALTYDRAKAAAPFVSAKGADLMAQRIRELAKEHGIPIVENKPLARALYANVKIGRVIPGEFFKAVAEVLAFVHWLKVKKQRAAMGLPVAARGQARRAA